MPPHQLALPWQTDLRTRLASVWPWPTLTHHAGPAGDLPDLVQAWLDGRPPRDGSDLVDALLVEGAVPDAGLALVAALLPLLDASGREGRFACTWAATLLVRAQGDLGDAVWGDAAWEAYLPPVEGLPEALRDAPAKVAAALRVRLTAGDDADGQWPLALQLLALEGAPGAAIALDAGWPEEDRWEGLICRECGAAHEAGVVLEGGAPVAVWAAAPGEAPVETVPLDAVGEGPARWVDAPARWVLARWADGAPADAALRLAVRCTEVACPRCGFLEPLVHRMPGGLDPMAPVAAQS